METTSLTLRLPQRIKAALIKAAAKARPAISANKLAAHLIEVSLSGYTVAGRTKGAFKISTMPGGEAIKHSAAKP